MNGQGRPNTPWLSVLLAIIGTPLAVAATDPELARPVDVPMALLHTAELADVFFIDPDRGWAVGDRGVIWNTEDGGRHWHLQRSTVRCRLASVWFVNDETGWIVGGRTHPYTHRTSGVVLRTRDGGQRWEQVTGRTLPALRQVKFIDARHGWVISNSSPLYPSGLLRTADGGDTWSGVPSNTTHHWLTGDFLDQQNGSLAGRHDHWAVVDRVTIKHTERPTFGLAQPRRLRLAGESIGWLVGDGGLVLRSTSGGRTWQKPDIPLLNDATRHFDFCALAAYGNHCWIGGTPGTLIFHTADQGHSWEVYRTDQSLPIRSLMFLDANRGWAVGSLGTILATRDGGQTWRAQRSKQRRAALLGLFSHPDKIPFELMSRLAGNDGYITAVELLNRRDIEVPSTHASRIAERTHEAIVAIGGSVAESAWRFPLRQPGLTMRADSILDGWDQANDGRGAARLEEHIVAKIRQWRPDVIVTESIHRPKEDSLPLLINQLVLSAVEKAATSESYPEQVAIAGLAPWKVKKVFSTASDHQATTVQLVTTQLAPRLGRSLSDIASDGRTLLFDRPQFVPTMVGFRLLTSDLPDDFRSRDVFSGIALRPGDEARRALVPTARTSLDELKRMVQKRRNIEQIIAQSRDHAAEGLNWLSHVDELTRGLTEESAVNILDQLAWRYVEVGQSQLAADVFQHLVQQFTNHPFAEAAAIWLLHFYSSSEVAWRWAAARSVIQSEVKRSEQSGTPRQVVDFENLNVRQTGLPSMTDSEVGTAKPQMVSHQHADHQATQGDVNKERMMQLESLIKQTWPTLLDEPQVRLPLAAFKRRASSSHVAGHQASLLANGPSQDAWSECARAELWLNKPHKIAPKPIFPCLAATTKPRLDGKLDDEIWRRSSPVALKSALLDDAGWPAAAMISYDDEFLYFAVTCRKATNTNESSSDGPRPRDANLSDRDRVDLLIDLDRDYATYYRLTIDDRGWTGESCWEDRSWDPQWFVASAATQDTWTAEVAIPLQQLTARPPKSRDAWAIGIQRIIPTVGFQSWTQPAAIQPRPEGFGLMMFD